MDTSVKDIDYKTQVLKLYFARQDSGQPESDDTTAAKSDENENDPEENAEKQSTEEQEASTSTDPDPVPTNKDNPQSRDVAVDIPDVVVDIPDPPVKIPVHRKTIHRKGDTLQLGKDCHGNRTFVRIPKAAMAGKKSSVTVAASTYDSIEQLAGNINHQLIEQVQGNSEPASPYVKLNVEGEEETTFSDYIQIMIPHTVAESDLGFLEVYRSDSSSCQSLPTALEAGEQLPDAYFIAHDDYAIILTKSFSVYNCRKGHVNRLDMKAWVYTSYFADSQSLEVRVVLTPESPRNSLISNGILHGEALVWEKCEPVKFPCEIMEFGEKDKMRFLLQKPDNWVSEMKPVKQADNLGNLIECSECVRRRSSCALDAAVFDIELPRTATPPERFKGAVHIVVCPHSAGSWGMWFKRIFCPWKWKEEKRRLERLPVMEELCLHYDEPLHSVTTIPVNFSLSEPLPRSPSDSGYGAGMHLQRFLSEQEPCIAENDNDSALSFSCIDGPSRLSSARNSYQKELGQACAQARNGNNGNSREVTSHYAKNISESSNGLYYQSEASAQKLNHRVKNTPEGASSYQERKSSLRNELQMFFVKMAQRVGTEDTNVHHLGVQLGLDLDKVMTLTNSKCKNDPVQAALYVLNEWEKQIEG